MAQESIAIPERPAVDDWRARTRVFYGWWIVAAMFVLLMLTGGVGFYVVPVFIGPFQHDFGWSMEQISWSVGVFAIVYGISGPLVGGMIARIGAKRTMLAAAVLASLTFVGYSAMQSLWMLYLIALLAGFAVAGTTLVPTQTVITSWFEAYRGRAMALTLLGIGFGGVFLPPLCEFLIRFWGWRLTWGAIAAALWLVVIPLIAVFVRTRPSDFGLRPDGAAAREHGRVQEHGDLRGLTVGRAVRTVAFPLLIAVYLTQLIGQSILNFHFVPFAIQEGGFTSQQAAWFLGIAIGFSVVGKILFGGLADRFSPALLMAVTGLLAALGPLMLEILVLRADVRDPRMLWLYVIPYGIGYGGQIVLLPMLVGRCFGPLHFGKIQGLVTSGFAVGILVGVPLAGRIFDRTGSYEISLIVAVVVFLASGVFSALVRPDAYRHEFAAES